jgi:hypothetical protein
MAFALLSKGLVPVLAEAWVVPSTGIKPQYKEVCTHIKDIMKSFTDINLF